MAEWFDWHDMGPDISGPMYAGITSPVFLPDPGLLRRS